MKLTYYEFIKITKRKMILITLIIFSIINIFNILSNYTDKDKNNKEFDDGYWKAYHIVEGKMTQKNIDFIMKSYKKNADIVNKGGFVTNHPNKQFYTGYVSGDMNMFDEHRLEMERIFLYNDNIRKLKKLSLENID